MDNEQDKPENYNELGIRLLYVDTRGVICIACCLFPGRLYQFEKGEGGNFKVGKTKTTAKETFMVPCMKAMFSHV